MVLRSFFLIGLALCSSVRAEVGPLDLRFTRQASQRMVFDEGQALPLSSLEPSKIVGPGLMHPARNTAGNPEMALLDGKLVVKGEGATDSSLWFSGFNPFATYQVEIADGVEGTSIGLEFLHEGGEVLRVEAVCSGGGIGGVRWGLRGKEKTLMEGEAKAFRRRSLDKPVTLVVQMAAVGFNVYLQQDGRSELVGRADFVQQLDVRRKDVFQNTSTWLRVAGQGGARAVINRATAALTPGMGQADIRAITDEEGTPLLDGGRVWFTATTRGGGLPHPTQGVFSLDPGIFDIRFEGVVAFDRGDGLLRNELASHLFLDRPSGEWRGWTTAFSAYGDPAKQEKKEILAVRSTKDPRRGFSVMSSRPMGLVGDYEDPHGIFDKAAGKWRMLLCQNVNGYKAAVFESEKWDGGFQRIAGPVTNDSTGTTIQKVGGVRYAFFGSSDRCFHVCSFPDLKPLGNLDIDLPPWSEPSGNGRVWPNLIPLPEGYPAPYLLLTFDRTNFPGMEGPNWTYGAMMLYHGHPRTR